MEKYANIRGAFFEKHLRSNGNGNLVNTLAASQSTRTRVLNSVVSAKAVADAKEKELWKTAEQNTFAYADKEDAAARMDAA